VAKNGLSFLSSVFFQTTLEHSQLRFAVYNFCLTPFVVNDQERLYLTLPERKCIFCCYSYIVIGRPCPPDLIWLGQKNSTQRIHLRSLVPERKCICYCYCYIYSFSPWETLSPRLGMAGTKNSTERIHLRSLVNSFTFAVFSSICTICASFAPFAQCSMTGI
jgi:hypothetical protein